MKLFFAGTEPRPNQDILKKVGAKNTLQSAYYLSYSRQPNELQFENFLLDSGGFTARKQGAVISVKKYADYINKFNVKYAFNLDTNDTEETLRNQAYLDAATRAKIIPVYHYSEYKTEKYKDLINKYADNYDYIGIGGTAEGSTVISDWKLRFFDYVFNQVRTKIKLHGLAVTSVDLLKRYPWYSVDSTTWLSADRFGSLFRWDGLAIKNDKSPKKNRRTKRLSNPLWGHDSTNIRLEFVAKQFIKMESDITNMWRQRGIEWNQH